MRELFIFPLGMVWTPSPPSPVVLVLKDVTRKNNRTTSD